MVPRGTIGTKRNKIWVPGYRRDVHKLECTQQWPLRWSEAGVQGVWGGCTSQKHLSQQLQCLRFSNRSFVLSHSEVLPCYCWCNSAPWSSPHRTPEGRFKQGSRSGVPKMLFSNSHLTGRALGSKPKSVMSRAAVHHTWKQVFTRSLGNVILLRGPFCNAEFEEGRWSGWYPEYIAGVCLPLCRLQLFGGDSGLISGELRPFECADMAELEEV